MQDGVGSSPSVSSLLSLPALTVNASLNCSRHEDVPISRDAFARCTNLSTVF